MTLQWIGAAMVIGGCGGFGLTLAAGEKREIQMLRQLMAVLEEMEWELQYRLTPLSGLCRIGAKAAKGRLQRIFLDLAKQLDGRDQAYVSGCMNGLLVHQKNLPRSVRRLLTGLGNSLGRLDLTGQVQGLQAVKAGCARELERLERNRDTRLRSYQTLGLCAGAALAILLV